MKKLISMTAIFATTASFAFAQDQLTDVSDIDDQIEAVEDSVQDDFDKDNDSERYTNVNYQNGWKGSVSLSGAMNSFTKTQDGDDTTNEDQNFAIGARVTNGAGVWEQSIGVYYSYSASDDGSTSADDDDDPNESFRASYELNRNFSPRLYGFTTLTANRNSNDVIDYSGNAAVGLGYRIVNNPNFTWRVQAGPAYNYVVSDENDLESEGAGAVVGSRLFYQLTDTAQLTNETEYQWSEDVQAWSNDLGINFKLTENLVTRLGYVTNARDIPDEDYSTLENNFTVSAVLSF